MAQYTQRTQPMHRPGQTEHGHGGGGALAYGGKPPPAGAVVASPQPRASPAAPYAPQPYPNTLRLHQPGYGSAALSYRDNSYCRSGGGAVGAGGDYRGGVGGRMSLLGAGGAGGAYLPPPAPPAHHPPPADPPPFKKIRLSADRSTTTLSHHQPLRVDTREPVNTYNTVEVLSPNPPSEPTLEDQSFRSTKDDLLQQISKVDREMALSDTTLTKLRKKQEELEQAANKPVRAEEPEETPASHRSLAQCVYADNRKKAAAAHAVFSHLGPPVLWPVYNQPQDTEIYHENIRKHRLFRKRLVEHLKRFKQEVERREEALVDTYTRKFAEWSRRVERIEQGQKRKAKEARNREFFEKVFPELRKHREERERFNRLGARVKSEAELEEIADGLHEQEHEDKKMRSLTVVPPLMLDARERRMHYVDTNPGRCMDMEAEHKEIQMRNVWTTGEMELFREKYLQHPKNFGLIASFLPRKSVKDCVRYYYLSKKAENYKQLLRKPRQRRSARNPPRPVSEPELPAGVTTRLQRSQGGTSGRPMDKESCGEEVGVTMLLESVTCIPVPPDLEPENELRPVLIDELPHTPPLPPSPPPSSSPVPPAAANISLPSSPAPAPLATVPTPPPSVTVAATTSSTATATDVVNTSMISVVTVNTCSVVTSTAAASNAPAAAHTPTPPTDNVTIERVITITPSSAISSIPIPSVMPLAPTVPSATGSAQCAVCGAGGAMRGVSRARAHHYSLREESAINGARVCETCHCRCVRSRYTRCPVPTCPGPKVRAKRLRHLPPRWHDLPIDVKRPLMDEFQIPSELSKCCLACFKRITRRLETAGDAGASEPGEEDAARFRALLREHGTAWDRMAAACGRTPATLKAFYFSYRKRFQLDVVASRAAAAARESDSEWSAASSGDTDTASAGSSPRPPRPTPPAPTSAPLAPLAPRPEYDSSATETADEENEAPAHKVQPATTSIATSTTTSISLSCTPSTPQRNGPAPAPLTTTAPPPAPLTTTAAPPAAPLTTTTAPLTVRDVVLNMIEISLMKNSQPVPPSTKTAPLKIPVSTPRESLATLSVVNSGHAAAAAPRSPHRPATITPLAQPPPPGPDTPKEGLVVLHIEPRPEPLLDLSVKRHRQQQDNTYPQQHHNKPAYRNSIEYGYRGQSDSSSPTQYKQNKPTPQPPQRHNAQLKPLTNTKGSITLGTPVEARLSGRRSPSDSKPGSITAGTPVHHLPEKRTFDYCRRRSPAAYYTTKTRPLEQTFSPTAAAYSRSPYGLEQRQIIMADFITSQQMHGAARAGRGGERPPSSPPPAHPPPAPPPQYSPQQRRESVSVIQRHTPHHYPPPGHEAFTSLVDVASAATALPVPRDKQDKTNHHPHHDIRIHERIQRDMSMVQKYHQQHHQHQQHQQQQHQQQQQQQQQIQYQALERDRRAQQAQYMERDRQIAMQQGRERERALAAMQERHMVIEHHQQQQAQHVHDRIHHAQVVSSEEARRLMTSAATYSTAKHRAITPHHLERKDSRPAGGAGAGVGVQAGGAVVGAGVGTGAGAGAGTLPGVVAGGRPAEGTLTAASLIDAIITHQISQTSEQRFPQTSIIRECDSGSAGVGVGVGAGGGGGGGEEPPPGHTTSIKLGDLASNIITRDFCSPLLPQQHHNNRFAVPISEGYTLGGAGGGGAAGEDWKRRDAPKHAPYLEPVSPPDTHHGNRSNSNRRYSGAGGGTGGGAGGVLTAFDYVTNRIVEVMRDADDRKQTPLTFPTGGYAYPYSALNVSSAGDAPAPAPAAPTAAPLAPPAAPEPAPLMSAQYEPLSDED